MSTPTPEDPVIVYTTPGCPDCAAVKRYLKNKGVSFEERDVSKNPAWLDEMKRASGVRIAPVTVVDENAFYGTFADQRPRIDAALAEMGKS